MKKTNKKYYWKVVRPINSYSPGIFKSCVIGIGIYSLLYKIGVPTKSAMKENGIFVFETRKNARKFNCNQGGTIFKCEVEGEEIKCPKFYNIYDLENNNKYLASHSFPEGTRSFPSVTLIK